MTPHRSSVGIWSLELGAWILLLRRSARAGATASTAAALTLPAAARAAGGTAATVGWRRGVSESVDLVGIDLLVANAVAVLVEISHRLLKQARLRISLRHGAFGDIELVLAHADVGE